MCCAIWYHFYNLINVKNTRGGVLLLLKMQAKACNFTKINTPSWVFSTFFELYKWYQITQRISYISKFSEMILYSVCALKFIFLIECISFTQYCQYIVKVWNNKSPGFSIYAHFCVSYIFIFFFPFEIARKAYL